MVIENVVNQRTSYKLDVNFMLLCYSCSQVFSFVFSFIFPTHSTFYTIQFPHLNDNKDTDNYCHAFITTQQLTIKRTIIAVLTFYLDHLVQHYTKNK